MKNLLSLIPLIIGLTACGGGGGGDQPPTPPPPQRTTPYGSMFDGKLIAGSTTVWRSICNLDTLKGAAMAIELVGNQPGVDAVHCALSAQWIPPKTESTQPLVLALRPSPNEWVLTLRQVMTVTYTDGSKASYARVLTYNVAPIPVANG